MMLVLPAKLTHDDAPACMRMLQQGIAGQNATATVVDASALSQFDSSALAILLECRRIGEDQRAKPPPWAHKYR